MALFFKTLRRRLLNNKKFGKYLLYALGEILIVITGILVAVEVNNNNERQKEKETQIELLMAIKAELEIDLKNFKTDIGVHKAQVRSSLIILDHLENNLPYHDTLSKHFLETCNWTFTGINKGGYETLKSIGVGMMDNMELRNSIIFLYDAQYVLLQDFAKDLKNHYYYGEKNILNSRFVEAEDYDLVLGEYWEDLETVDHGMITTDFEGLKNDAEYLYYLKTTKNKHKLYIVFLEDATKKISGLIASIDEELKTLET